MAILKSLFFAFADKNYTVKRKYNFYRIMHFPINHVVMYLEIRLCCYYLFYLSILYHFIKEKEVYLRSCSVGVILTKKLNGIIEIISFYWH